MSAGVLTYKEAERLCDLHKNCSRLFLLTWRVCGDPLEGHNDATRCLMPLTVANNGGILEQTSGKLKRLAAARVIASKSILPTSSLSFFIRLNSCFAQDFSLSRLCPFFSLSLFVACVLCFFFLQMTGLFPICSPKERFLERETPRDSQFGGCLTGDSLPDVSLSVDHSLMTLTPPCCDPGIGCNDRQ